MVSESALYTHPTPHHTQQQAASLSHVCIRGRPHALLRWEARLWGGRRHGDRFQRIVGRGPASTNLPGRLGRGHGDRFWRIERRGGEEKAYPVAIFAVQIV